MCYSKGSMVSCYQFHVKIHVRRQEEGLTVISGVKNIHIDTKFKCYGGKYGSTLPGTRKYKLINVPRA